MSREVRAHRIILHIVQVEMHCAMALGLTRERFVCARLRGALLPLCQPPKFRYEYFLMEINIVFFFFLSKLLHFMQCLGMLAGKLFIVAVLTTNEIIFPGNFYPRFKYRRNAMIRQAELLVVVV